jgi:hypothetical protein
MKKIKVTLNYDRATERYRLWKIKDTLTVTSAKGTYRIGETMSEPEAQAILNNRTYEVTVQ